MKPKKKTFKVECGSLVTVYRKRIFTVRATNEQEAKNKAKNAYWDAVIRAGYEIGGTIEVNSVEEL